MYSLLHQQPISTTIKLINTQINPKSYCIYIYTFQLARTTPSSVPCGWPPSTTSTGPRVQATPLPINRRRWLNTLTWPRNSTSMLSSFKVRTCRAWFVLWMYIDVYILSVVMKLLWRYTLLSINFSICHVSVWEQQIWCKLTFKLNRLFIFFTLSIDLP